MSTERCCSFICFGHTEHYLVVSHSLAKHHPQPCRHYADIKLCLTLLSSTQRYFPRPKSPPLPLHYPDNCHIVSGSELDRTPNSIQDIRTFNFRGLPGSQTNSAHKSNPAGTIQSKSKCKHNKHKQEQITPEHHQTLENKTVWQRR